MPCFPTRITFNKVTAWRSWIASQNAQQMVVFNSVIEILTNQSLEAAREQTRFWLGTCHQSFKNIPVPYTNFAKKYTRLYTNFMKMYTRPYTNFAKMYTQLYTNFPKMYTQPYTNFPKIYTRPYTNFPKCIHDFIPIFRKCRYMPDLKLKHSTKS